MNKIHVRFVIFTLVFFFACEAFGAVRILTFHYNHAEFIELQYKTLKKFLADDFELIVFNDAATIENERLIKDVCDLCEIKCIRFEPEWHFLDPLNIYLKTRYEEPSILNSLWEWADFSSIDVIAQHASVRHCHVIQYALDHYGYDHDDIVVIMDGDNFLVRPMSIRQLLGSNDIVGMSRQEDHQAILRKQSLTSPQLDKDHAWLPSVIFIAFNPSKLPNPRELQFHVDVINNHPNFPDNTIGDSGAAAYKYIAKYPQLKIKELCWIYSETFRLNFTVEQLKEMGFSNRFVKFIEDISPHHIQLFAFEHFMHFGSVSFYLNRTKKFDIFYEFINDLLKEECIHKQPQKLGFLKESP